MQLNSQPKKAKATTVLRFVYPPIFPSRERDVPVSTQKAQKRFHSHKNN
jgi:hypothetical protein